MDWLCDDLLLLTVFAYRGRLAQAYATGYALMGAELVRLAAMGRIGIVEDMIVITSEEPTGDAELDTALTEIGESEDPPPPDEWVAQPRPRIAGRYLERLEAARVVRAQTRFSATRWLITDASRLAEARGRLDAIAGSAVRSPPARLRSAWPRTSIRRTSVPRTSSKPRRWPRSRR